MVFKKLVVVCHEGLMIKKRQKISMGLEVPLSTPKVAFWIVARMNFSFHFV